MASTITGAYNDADSPSENIVRRATIEKYSALGDFIDEINKPDNRELLVKTFGDQGITGFLKLTGAVKAAGTNDQVQWWEETRLHPIQEYTVSSSAIAAGNSQTVTLGSKTTFVRVGDVVLLAGGQRAYVSAVTAGTSYVIKNLVTGNLPELAVGSGKMAIVGNLYAQGTDQPSEFYESNVTKRTNDYMILKETYKVSGSQATNIGWINLGNGDYRWYMKNEADTRQRFMDKREMMMLLGQKVTSSDAALSGISGSEGYFAAIADRGINVACASEAAMLALSDFDNLIKEFDKQGANAEYALYVNRDQDLAIDDLLAKGSASSLTSGIATQFGAFNNDADMAVQLGFKSFQRGGYTFHKHDWKLLNDPQLLGEAKEFIGAAIPLSTVVDAKTGDRNPSLELNYKASNGYSREMEHWLTGSVLGASTDGNDFAQFNYRSEVCLVTRGANRHALITK
jgi:hypothetical protein|tara:strand:- start:11155 stop:12519 length:1365 start_codon:yes stop_codon:yes gene_type:complete